MPTNRLWRAAPRLSLVVLVVLALPFAAAAKSAGPGYATIQRVARKAGLRACKAHHKGIVLADGTVLSLVSYTAKNDRRDAKKLRSGSTSNQLDLVLLARAGKGWRLRWRFNIGTSLEGKCDDEDLIAGLWVMDYDKDGAPEALVRYYDSCMVAPGVGDDKSFKLAIVNLTPKPRKAIDLDLYTKSAALRSKGSSRFRDLDGDGHPDLLIHRQDFEGESTKPTGRSVTCYLWSAKGDRYIKPAPSAWRKHPKLRANCPRPKKR